MECVRYEWKKFIAFRFFWLLCVVAFLFNLWNLSELAKMSWPPAEAVKELYADLKRQPEEERERWLKELKENKISSYTGNPYAEEELYKKMPTASQLPRPSILRGKGLLSLLLCFIIIL